MTKKKFDMETPPHKFPTVWNACEEVNLDVDALINKHVWLAINEYLSDVFVMESTTKSGHAGIYISLGDGFEKEIDLEEVYGRLEKNYTNKDDFLKMAAGFKRIVAILEQLAETAPE